MAFQRLRILLLPVLLGSLLAGLAPAASPDETFAAAVIMQPVGSSVIVSATVLNVRKGPGTTYPIVDQVSQGTVLTVLERNDASDWLKIETLRKIIGWVASRYVVPISSDASTAVPQRSVSSGSQGSISSPPAYAGLPFRPSTSTTRDGTITECFGSGNTPLRSVSANTPVQVIGVGDFAPPPNLGEKLGPGPYAKIRIWDGQYAWIAVNLINADANTLPRTSSICEDYDRIDWSRVVRPTPVPYRAEPSTTGGGSHAGCCRTCRAGKACGDTCIARNKTCHVGSGCACNG